MDFTRRMAQQYYQKKKTIEYGFKGYDVQDFEAEAIMAMPRAADKFRFDTSLQF